MDKDVTDGVLIDVRGADISSLLSESVDSAVKTALDRVLMSSATGCNGFDNSIDID
jgi:hypothetical protein